jgi:hypothetical protein
VWGDTVLELAKGLEGRRWWCGLSGREIPVDSGGVIRVADVLAELPVGLVTTDAT